MAAPPVSATQVTTGGYFSSPFDVSVTVPSLSDGDMMVCFLAEDTTRTVDSVPSGWTSITSVTVSGYNMYAYAKYVATASAEPASYTWSFNGGANVKGIIHAISGADPDESNISFATSTGPASGTITAPDVTVSASDSLILRIAADLQSVPTSITHPSGELSVVESISDGMGVEVSSSSASTDPGTADFSYVPTWHTSVCAITLAIPPAATAGFQPTWAFNATQVAV